ncbi:hypothetical protein LV82_01703 [Albidovulum inexpectatum]|uniref:Uncharacterized protein n=1 Tax=Albidovulum inexpectatum TaxID=196587 RepID=A0A2S5JHQ7_9RHOB|nr:hypothetical protein [Albidovulum inexpectatum]PPB80970.1 hypothetical protein LV82_01703 [Albidovulum inexpectatum]
MTPPDTNPQRQVRRHRPSVWAITAAIVGVVLIAIVILGIYPSGEVTRDAPLAETGASPAATR